MVGSPTHPVMLYLVMLWKIESPARRSAGGCQVVGAGPRLPGLGRNWAQTEAQGGWWWGPGPAAGGGAAASPRLLFKPHNYQRVRDQQACAALRAAYYRVCILFLEVNEGATTGCR